jgi:hypothetical protein
MIDQQFTDDLAHLLNRHSVDDETKTPDFMLAEMVADFLQVYANTMTNRERWYGRLSDKEKKQLANPKGRG